MKYLIIGGVAGGATTAARLRRMDEHCTIIMFEESDLHDSLCGWVGTKGLSEYRHPRAFRGMDKEDSVHGLVPETAVDGEFVFFANLFHGMRSE